jgi:hypothetical protein
VLHGAGRHYPWKKPGNGEFVTLSARKASLLGATEILFMLHGMLRFVQRKS